MRMKIAPRFLLSIVVGVAGCVCCAGLARSAERPWNIVLILADDLGWNGLACSGSDLHETPCLDRLAGEGVRFAQAYAAAPVCTPTRASILTGKFPARLHITKWREAAARQGQERLLEPIARADLPLEELTLAEILQQAGYYTAHVGKWHLGSAEFYPEAHGFHVNVGGTLWGAPQTYFYPFRGRQYSDEFRYVPGLEPGTEGDYLTDRLTDKALEVIDTAGDRPFFLNLWFHTVHTPIEGKPELVAKYRAKAKPDAVHRNPDYAAMVESLDQNVGRVLDRLSARGLAERTIVVFLSDNGGYIGTCPLQPDMPVTSNAPLRSGKGSLYDGGIRVPLIVTWPGHTPKGAVCSEPVSSCDLLPTLLQMAGVACGPLAVDGQDFSPWLTNPAAAREPRTLYFHYPHYYATTTPVAAVRAGDWKLLEFFEDQRLELYDLAADPGETTDLSQKLPEPTAALHAQLQRWRTEVDAQLPTPNPDWRAK
jgi:arylsulfatase A